MTMTFNDIKIISTQFIIIQIHLFKYFNSGNFDRTIYFKWYVLMMSIQIIDFIYYLN